MTLLQRLYRGRTDFDFVSLARRRWFIVSGVVLAISVFSLVFHGFNLGVDFEGGTQVEVRNESGASVSDVRDALTSLGLEGARVQLTGGVDGIRVQTEELSAEAVEELARVVAEVGGVPRSEVSTREVGPTFGAQVAESAVRALVIFLIVVSAFIAVRFEWRMAGTALVALFHDLLITAGIYSLTGFEVTPATVIAILTILGYSLYDTVVVFDKIEEHIEDAREKRTITGIVNVSMNQVLMRSLNTSLTSLLPVGSLLFVGSFLLGAATLREFALALFVGISAGTYSSLFIASPLLALWKERQAEWQKVQTRVARKASPSKAAAKAGRAATDDRKQAARATARERAARAKARAERSAAETRAGRPAKAPSAAAEPAGEVDLVSEPEAAPEPKAAPTPGSGATPRPPKKRRKKR